MILEHFFEFILCFYRRLRRTQVLRKDMRMYFFPEFIM